MSFSVNFPPLPSWIDRANEKRSGLARRWFGEQLSARGRAELCASDRLVATSEACLPDLSIRHFGTETDELCNEVSAVEPRLERGCYALPAARWRAFFAAGSAFLAEHDAFWRRGDAATAFVDQLGRRPCAYSLPPGGLISPQICTRTWLDWLPE